MDMLSSLSSFVSNAIRILKLARKPTREEFVRMLKITGVGFLALGIIGYIFQLIEYIITFAR